MMTDLLIFPIDREKALRLGARARWQDWPLHHTGGLVPMGEGRLVGEPYFLAARAIEEIVPRGPLMDEARAENERLRGVLTPVASVTVHGGSGDLPDFAVPPPPPGVLTAVMIDRGLGQRRTSRETGFHFGGVQFEAEPVLGAHDFKSLGQKLWRGLIHFVHSLLPRGVSVASTLAAQPGLHHGNQYPDFPVLRPDAPDHDANGDDNGDDNGGRAA